LQTFIKRSAILEEKRPFFFFEPPKISGRNAPHQPFFFSEN